MKFINWLLFPFALLYGWLMRFRNHLYDIERKPVVEFDRVIISVGNLSVGGTGKTPMVEYLISLLKDDYQLATLSRGYGRKTKGFRVATHKDTARTIGDEPFQFYQKFGDRVAVTVGEERMLAIPSLLLENEGIEVFLLDDAYQHRKVARDLNILLMDYHRPFYKDFVLPMGRLREPRIGAKRADCVMVTKCPPDLTKTKKEEIKAAIHQYSGEKPVCFATIEYGAPLSFQKDNTFSDGNQWVMLTGIAHPGLFKDDLSSTYEIVGEKRYPDHHAFTEKDLDDLLAYVRSKGSKEVAVMTTEKDMVRLLPLKGHAIFDALAFFYVPIVFRLDEAEPFRQQVLKVIEEKKRIN